MNISEATIRQHATDPSFSRGEAYYHRGAVTDIVRRGNTILAEVEGSEVTPYRVSLQIDTGGITAAQCTCPYDFEGWCKHIVAAALTCARQPDSIEARPTLAQLLDRLNPVQTQRLVQALVEEQPDLIDAIDQQVMQMTHPAPPKQVSTPARRTAIDAAPFRRQVKQILREGLRHLEDGYEEDPFSDGLLEVVDKAQNFSRNGDGHSAIVILQAITATYADEWDDLLEYGGDCYSIADALDEAWTEAILSADLFADLSADLSSPEATDLGVMLEEWQDAIDADFSMSLAALQQGWQDADLQRVLQGHGYRDPERLEVSFGQDLARIRLRILDRQGREQEYLNLARTEGLIQEYLTRLAERGDVATAMTTAQERMSTAEEAFALAQTLRENDHLPEALTIAQTGLPLPGTCRYDLANWTSELAEGLGDAEIALQASVLAFTLRPSFAGYQRVETLAAAQWQSVKLELLNALRHYREWGAEQAKVDIFLHEELIDDAIGVVQSDTFYRTDLVLRVMQAAVSHRPDWVIESACKRAEPIMERGKSDRYREAVQWLQQAKAAYLQDNRRSEWVAYFSQLQDRHVRKRKLMELFKPL